MKPPKLWNGPSAIGESDVRSLHGLDMPFAKTIQLGSISRKRNGFDEVTVTRGKECVYISCTVVGGTHRAESYDVERFVRVAHRGAALFSRDPYPVHVGDGYHLHVTSTGISYSGVSESDYDRFFMWPTLLTFWGRGAYQRSYYLEDGWAGGSGGDPDETAGTNKETDYFMIDSRNGLANDDQFGPSRWASGTNSDGEHMCGWAHMYPTDRTDMYTRIASAVSRMGVINAHTKVLTPSGGPWNNNRRHFPFHVFCVGRGALAYVHAVHEEVNYVDESDPPAAVLKPLVRPWIAISSDHGKSWSRDTAGYLNSYMVPRLIDYLNDEGKFKGNPFVGGGSTGENVPYAPGGPTREFLDNRQIRAWCEFATIIYVGGGKSFLFLPCGFESLIVRTTADSYGFWDEHRCSPMLFYGEPGSYSRVNWPADAWHTKIDGTRWPGTEWLCNFVTTPNMRQRNWGFGQGCAYIPFKNISTGQQVYLVTHDAGSSWETVEFPPTLISVAGGAMCGTTVKPYINELDPGEIWFASPTPGTRTRTFYRTDGNFTTFKRMFSAKGGPAILASSSIHETSIVYYGGEHGKEYVYPAFPGEFEDT